METYLSCTIGIVDARNAGQCPGVEPELVVAIGRPNNVLAVRIAGQTGGALLLAEDDPRGGQADGDGG